MRKPYTKQVNFIPDPEVRKFLARQKNKTETINDALKYLMRSSCSHDVTVKSVQESCLNCGEIVSFTEFSHKHDE